MLIVDMKILNVGIVNTNISEYWNCWYEKYWILELLIWKILNVEIVGIIVWKMLNIEIVDMNFFECWNYCMAFFVLIWKMLNVGIVDMKFQIAQITVKHNQHHTITYHKYIYVYSQSGPCSDIP